MRCRVCYEENKKNSFFGSSDGAVEFDKDMKLPRGYSSKMIFSDFKLFYQTIYPGDEDSPLKASINDTKVLKLKIQSKQILFAGFFHQL